MGERKGCYPPPPPPCSFHFSFSSSSFPFIVFSPRISFLHHIFLFSCFFPFELFLLFVLLSIFLLLILLFPLLLPFSFSFPFRQISVTCRCRDECQGCCFEAWRYVAWEAWGGMDEHSITPRGVPLWPGVMRSGVAWHGNVY